MNRTSPTFFALVFCFVAAISALAQSKSGAALPIVYDDVTEGSTKLDKDAHRVYAGKFRIVEVTEKDGFVPNRIKGYGTAANDPRGTKERQIPAKVVCIFIVMPDGRAAEPRIISSTDPRLSKEVIKSFAYRRWVPARFRGRAVASLHSSQIDWGGETARDRIGWSDGLGIMSNRDR